MIRVLFLLLFAATAAAESFDIPDVEVVTHEGKKVRFYSDLVKGRTVAVNFIYTNCSTICPSSGALFSALQKEHERVQFISISIEPKTDTPAKLAAWSKRFRSTPQWTLVTGEQADIEKLVKAFGQTTARPQDHTPLTIVGSDRTGTWQKLYGFPGPEKIGKLVSEVSR
ncbi:MAG TPA: SCO family protein [Thermoanaerobaculia bacterium]|nr:SCO family protein [Thermoanaerobaculia bacterium]